MTELGANCTRAVHIGRTTYHAVDRARPRRLSAMSTSVRSGSVLAEFGVASVIGFRVGPYM